MTFFIARLLRRAMSRKQTTYSALDETFSSSISASEAYSTEDPSWRPSYLRRRVYALFVAVFFLLVVAVEVLLFISDGKCGLATSVAGLHYLWTYGPTAVLTLVASFWVRVDYQMKSMLLGLE
ncbi:hypothetical protein RRF57_013001 [Xylaria bambusicola]|uniref:Uncharacterized protein n=1 Tax=Xylaria bambusicola TaxID=326684 RepID=A0AAN7V4U6_9PEZI